MTTMRCEAVRDALPALARGTLGDAEAAEVRAHLATCDECADAWTVVEALAHARPAVPAALSDRVSAELKRRGPAVRTARIARPMRWLGGAGLAAAAVIAALIAWPETDNDPARTIDPVATPAGADPFLNEDLFGVTTPTESELDGEIRVAAADEGSLPAEIVAEEELGSELAPIAMDVGSPLGDWPGADGMSAGEMMIDDLSVEEMQLLLAEMES